MSFENERLLRRWSIRCIVRKYTNFSLNLYVDTYSEIYFLLR